MSDQVKQRTPGQKLLLAILIGAVLAIPLFSVWLLVYDRQNQSQTAQSSIAEGWGGPQLLDGPQLVIPYRTTREDTVVEDGKRRTETRTVWEHMTLSPERLELTTGIAPELRKRSIYEVVVYQADNLGKAQFALPPDLERYDIDPANIAFDRAELRIGLSDPRGLGANPEVAVGGKSVRLQPGGGTSGGSGFFAFIDASALRAGALEASFAFKAKGNGSFALEPSAGDTVWKVTSAWPHPSFAGAYLPEARDIGRDGFSATYRVGNLALGQSLVSKGKPSADRGDIGAASVTDAQNMMGDAARIDLVQPVDLYSRVDRATKYGFLHIGFTFLALLMFDVLGRRRVSAVTYLLVGAALVLFFVLLLAFAEVIGFTAAYLAASLAIAGLVSAYTKAILGNWRRGAMIGVMLIALYATLYILLGLEALSLLIGSLLLFAALAAVMYATRNLDWSRPASEQ